MLGDIRFDFARTGYYHDYMEAILIAMTEGVNVVGCLAWSLVDNLEWADGYNAKFGMQYVNFTTQERYYKSSFFTYVNAFAMYQEGFNSSGGLSGGYWRDWQQHQHDDQHDEYQYWHEYVDSTVEYEFDDNEVRQHWVRRTLCYDRESISSFLGSSQQRIPCRDFLP